MVSCPYVRAPLSPCKQQSRLCQAWSGMAGGPNSIQKPASSFLSFSSSRAHDGAGMQMGERASAMRGYLFQTTAASQYQQLAEQRLPKFLIHASPQMLHSELQLCATVKNLQQGLVTNSKLTLPDSALKTQVGRLTHPGCTLRFPHSRRSSCRRCSISKCLEPCSTALTALPRQ